MIIGDAKPLEGLRTKLAINKIGKIIFLFCLLVLISAVVVYYFVKNDNNQTTANNENPGYSQQAIKNELEEQLKNPVKDDSDIENKKTYYSGVFVKLSALGDSSKTADLYINEVAKLNITFDVQTQEWLVNSLIANGYTDNAKKVVDDTLVILNKNLQQVEGKYKPELQSKIIYYQKLEANL